MEEFYSISDLSIVSPQNGAMARVTYSKYRPDYEISETARIGGKKWKKLTCTCKIHQLKNMRHRIEFE